MLLSSFDVLLSAISPFEQVDRFDVGHTGKWHVVFAGTRVGVFKMWYVLCPSRHLGHTDVVGRGEASFHVSQVSGNRHFSYTSYINAFDMYRDARDAGRVKVVRQ